HVGPSHYRFPTTLGSAVSDVEQTEDGTMLQSSSRFREHKSATSDDLERKINQLREMLDAREMTSAYLIELEAAIEAVGRAIKEERWAREGYSEFLGE